MLSCFKTMFLNYNFIILDCRMSFTKISKQLTALEIGYLKFFNRTTQLCNTVKRKAVVKLPNYKVKSILSSLRLLTTK